MFPSPLILEIPFLKIKYGVCYGLSILIFISKSKDEDLDLPTFDLATILAATNNFSPANMIGAGGFGPVYKVIFFL